MQVKFYATLRDLLGVTTVELPLQEATTVGAVLAELTARYPALAAKLWREDGDLSKQLSVMLNGRAITFLQGLQTEAGPGDQLALFPPIGGG